MQKDVKQKLPMEILPRHHQTVSYIPFVRYFLLLARNLTNL